MGKRYYCDYCERSFIDDVESRKKHIKSVNHEILRKLHYNAFRDLKTLVREERAKIPCKRFKNYQECSFGDNCNYSHYSEAELRNFESIIHQEELEKAKVPKLLTLQDWLEKRSSSESLSSSTAKILQTEPSRIYNYRLPPSLIPATKEQIMSCKLEQWG
ncbi:zinc finger matrin-type protein 5-like [Cimex lectularius]|uniref:C3H1-type domain-containing protein n=1 Tax=Cimex lectularius TaxID=79782 RepID=A0A8I6RKF5_CIMLE|nr:zinc finger matrin-type protein 5-like [Cimex lectularius]